MTETGVEPGCFCFNSLGALTTFQQRLCCTQLSFFSVWRCHSKVSHDFASFCWWYFYNVQQSCSNSSLSWDLGSGTVICLCHTKNWNENSWLDFQHLNTFSLKVCLPPKSLKFWILVGVKSLNLGREHVLHQEQLTEPDKNLVGRRVSADLSELCVRACRIALSSFKIRVSIHDPNLQMPCSRYLAD